MQYLKKINILIATTGFPDKNNDDIAGKFVLTEALAYSMNGGHVKVLTPHQLGAKRKEKINKNLDVIRFRYFLPEKLQCLKAPNKPMYGQKRILSYLQMPILFLVFIFQLIIHARGVDIIHCQWTITALLAMPCKWLHRKPIVVTVRGSDVRLLPKFLNRFIHSKVDAVLDCYGDQKWNNDNKKRFPANYIKLPLIADLFATAEKKMPIDMYAPVQDRKDVFKIIYLGRFDRVKMIDGLPILLLIDAAKRLERYYKGKFHIFYIGDGDAAILSEMKARIKTLSQPHCITVLGPKNGVNDYLMFCDLGIGGIAFNAVSQEFSILGKPQLLFEGPYNLETPWKDKENCLMAKPGDVDELTSALAYALSNREGLKRIGRSAQTMMTKYVKNMKDGGAEYLHAFSSIINQGYNS